MNVEGPTIDVTNVGGPKCDKCRPKCDIDKHRCDKYR